MKAAWLTAAILSVWLVSSSRAESFQPCEWWLKAHNHLSTTDFRDVIVLDVREHARRLASNKYSGVPGGDLKCMTDTDILKAINRYCTQHPADTLSRAIPVIAETAVQAQAHRQGGTQ
jgi:hypothetical protein